MGHVHDGMCRLCGETYTGTGISSHVKGCLTAHADIAAVHHGLLVGVRADGPAGRFWMYVLTDPEAPLAALDAFLRETWFDDESTASAFEIEGTRYLDRLGPGEGSDDEETPPLESMDVDLGAIVRPRMEFTYFFDPQHPTAVELTVFDPYPRPESLVGEDEEQPVALVARNAIDDLSCSTCDSTATHLCLTCLHREESAGGESPDDEAEEDEPNGEATGPQAPPGRFTCEACAERHEGPLVPLENSPRCGVDELEQGADTDANR